MLLLSVLPRNRRLKKNGNSANFFMHVCNSKKIKVSFARILNGITSSDRCASFTTVVLNAKLLNWLRCTQTKQDDGKRRQSKRMTVEQQTWNSCRSLHHARDNGPITYFNDLCKPIELYIYARKKHPFTSYPAAKHPKRSKLAITNMRKKPVNLFYCTTRPSTLAPQ